MVERRQPSHAPGKTYFPAVLKSVARVLLFDDFEGIIGSR